MAIHAFSAHDLGSVGAELRVLSGGLDVTLPLAALPAGAGAPDDEQIVKNPCRAASARRTKATQRKVKPREAQNVVDVRDAMSERYRIAVILASGLGLRQGEAFWPIPRRRRLRAWRSYRAVAGKGVRRQRVGVRAPEGRKTRAVPLPGSVRDATLAGA